ncbi:MAG: hypothetical protein HYW05_00915 [Candidatus Diapherotrites archaeon]|nr:hypothetical protein [Candidatus Diapherotrites archaeon]
MANKMVHLRVPAELYLQSLTIVKEKGFASIQEFMRNAMRNFIDKWETEMAIERIRKLKGSLKGVKPLTEAEREKAFRDFLKMTPKQRSDLFREFGLENIRKA